MGARLVHGWVRGGRVRRAFARWVRWRMARARAPCGVPLWYAETPPEFAYFRPLSPDRCRRQPYKPLLFVLLPPLGGKFLNILSMFLFKASTFFCDLFDRSCSVLPRQASCLLLVVKISTTRLPMGWLRVVVVASPKPPPKRRPQLE